MKKKLFVLPFVLLLFIALALVQGKDSKQAGTSKSGTPKDGGTLTIGVSDNPDTMNPLYANDRVSLTVRKLYMRRCIIWKTVRKVCSC